MVILTHISLNECNSVLQLTPFCGSSHQEYIINSRYFNLVRLYYGLYLLLNTLDLMLTINSTLRLKESNNLINSSFPSSGQAHSGLILPAGHIEKKVSKTTLYFRSFLTYCPVLYFKITYQILYDNCTSVSGSSRRSTCNFLKVWLSVRDKLIWLVNSSSSLFNRVKSSFCRSLFLFISHRTSQYSRAFIPFFITRNIRALIS